MRAMYARRKPVMTIFQVLCPVFFAMFILSVAGGSDRDDPSVDRGSKAFQLSDYGHTTVVYGATPGAPISGGRNEQLQLANAYQQVLQSEHDLTKVVNQSTRYSPESFVYNYMVEAAESNGFAVVYRHIVGAEFMSLPNGTIMAIAFYNYDALHSPVISLNLVDNALLQHHVGAEYSIDVLSHPRVLQLSKEEQEDKDRKDAIDPKKIIITKGAITMVFPVIMASYMMTAVRERGTRTKHMQIMSGLKPIVLWTAMLLFDAFIHALTTAGTIITFNAYGIKVYAGLINSFYMFVFLMTFGLAMLPMMYLGSFLFQTPSTGFTVGAMFNILTGA